MPYQFPQYYQTGDRILVNGIYSIEHSEHRLPYEVTLIAGHTFPPCAECLEPVRFKLARLLPESLGYGELIVLHQIPELAA